MTAAAQPRIAVLGAGHTGPVIARVAMAAGYPVSIAASGDPADIELITQFLAPGAEPRWAADAVADADIVVLAIPLHKFGTVDPGALAGKLVVDTMNYWPPVDGVQPDVRRSPLRQQRDRAAPAGPVRRGQDAQPHRLPRSRRGPPPGRRAGPARLGVASDDRRAVGVVQEFVERIGYDAVRLDSLRAGRLLEPGGPVFGAALRRADFALALRAEAA